VLPGGSSRYLPIQVPEVVAHHHSEADQQLPEYQLLPGLQMHDPSVKNTQYLHLKLALIV
jgi:hypothetical protein